MTIDLYYYENMQDELDESEPSIEHNTGRKKKNNENKQIREFRDMRKNRHNPMEEKSI